MPEEPCEPETSVRKRLRELGTTRFWSRVGAVLGLLATLWATLVGQTIPDLLRSRTSPVAEFRDTGNRICGRLPQASGYRIPGPAGASQLDRARSLSNRAANNLAHDFLVTTVNPLDATIQQLLTLVAPPAYQRTLPRFQGAMTSLDHHLYALSGAVYDIAGEPSRAHIRFALVQAKRSYNRTLTALESGALMKLSACVGALSHVTDDLQDLNDRIAAPPR